jgi:adenosylhomocysteine nucleosidase
MEVVVLISADIEWRAVLKLFPRVDLMLSPYGEYFVMDIDVSGDNFEVTYFQGGWGKISAAASTQYVIDLWAPNLLVNLGTCGGFKGDIEKGSIILVEKTIVYDIIEQMGDADDHLLHYTTNLNLSWLREPYPIPVLRGLLVSGDRDILPGDIQNLKEQFGAVAADWESGAIAYVAERNNTPCLILRGVSDTVNVHGGEAYGNIGIYESSAQEIIERLVRELPLWINSIEILIE